MPIFAYLSNLGMGGGGGTVSAGATTAGGVRQRSRKRRYIEAESNAEFLKAHVTSRHSAVNAPASQPVEIKPMQIEKAEEIRKTLSDRDVVALLLMLSKL